MALHKRTPLDAKSASTLAFREKGVRKARQCLSFTIFFAYAGTITVANPSSNPILTISVEVVRKILDAVAGSAP